MMRTTSLLLLAHGALAALYTNVSLSPVDVSCAEDLLADPVSGLRSSLGPI